jgi:hypothetical protein
MRDGSGYRKYLPAGNKLALCKRSRDISARIPDPDGRDISESDMASLRGAKIASEIVEASPELFEGWEDWSVEVGDELGMSYRDSRLRTAPRHLLPVPTKDRS